MRHLNRGIAFLVFFLGMVVLPASYAQVPTLTITKDPNGGITLGIKKDDPKKDDTKKDDPKKDDTKKDDTKKDDTKVTYHKLGQVTGHIVSVTDKTVKLSVDVPKLDQGRLKAYQHAQVNLARARSPQDQINAQRAMADAQAHLYTTEKKEVEFTATDDAKARLAEPPQAFDDKGKLKTYTAKERAELKGSDKTTPGFPAEFSDLHPGMIAQVTLVSKKDPAKGPKKANPTPEEMDDYKPMISLILGAEMQQKPGIGGIGIGVN